MSEKPSGKKLVSRNTAMALGIMCAILAVGIVGAFILFFIEPSNRR